MSKKVKLSPPWCIYVSKLEALFGQDPDVKIDFDEKNLTVKFYISGRDKTEAFTEFFPDVVHFGNVDLHIVVVPDNVSQICDNRKLLEAMFKGNPALSYIQDITGIFPNPISYFVMKKEVVQIWEDNMADANGVESTLYQDLAREILGECEGIYFCTDIDDTEDDEESEDVDED